MSLKTLLQNWDEKDISYLEQLYTQHYQDEHFARNLIPFLSSGARLQNASTWLLKHFLENKHTIPKLTANNILKNLNKMHHWQSKLHCLQMLEYLSIPSILKNEVEQFIRINLTHHNKFVKAWAYQGFYILAKQFPQFQAEALDLFDLGMQEEAASVRARIRNMIKVGFE